MLDLLRKGVLTELAHIAVGIVFGWQKQKLDAAHIAGKGQGGFQRLAGGAAAGASVLVHAQGIDGALAASRAANASNMSAANAVMVGGQAVAMQSQLNFSRDMEREADRVGYGVMTDAGYEPQGFVSMFEKLQQAARLNDNGAFPYLRSHPMTTERIADAQARQQLLQAKNNCHPMRCTP